MDLINTLYIKNVYTQYTHKTSNKMYFAIFLSRNISRLKTKSIGFIRNLLPLKLHVTSFGNTDK